MLRPSIKLSSLMQANLARKQLEEYMEQKRAAAALIVLMREQKLLPRRRGKIIITVADDLPALIEVEQATYSQDMEKRKRQIAEGGMENGNEG